MIELIEKLVGSYGSIGPEHPTSYILIPGDPKHKPDVELLHICHSRLPQAVPNIHQEALLAAPKSDELSKSYLQWLIDGPFRLFSDHITIKETDNGQIYIHVCGLDDFPANGFMNFCIASRAPIEFRPTLELWSNLIELGVKPNLAMCLAGLSTVPNKITTLDTKLKCVGPPSWGHWWFDTTMDWTRLLIGQPTNLSSSFKQYPSGCLPTNRIWGVGSADTVLKRFSDYTISELMEMYPE